MEYTAYSRFSDPSSGANIFVGEKEGKYVYALDVPKDVFPDEVKDVYSFPFESGFPALPMNSQAKIDFLAMNILREHLNNRGNLSADPRDWSVRFLANRVRNRDEGAVREAIARLLER